MLMIAGRENFSHPINLRASLITTDVEVDQWHCLISEQLPISSESKMIRVSVVCEISLMLCHFLEHQTCYISIPDCYLAAAISSQAFIKFSFGDCSDYLRVPFFFLLNYPFEKTNRKSEKEIGLPN